VPFIGDCREAGTDGRDEVLTKKPTAQRHPLVSWPYSPDYLILTEETHGFCVPASQQVCLIGAIECSRNESIHPASYFAQV